LSRSTQPIKRILTRRLGIYKYPPSLEGQGFNSYSLLSLSVFVHSFDLSIGASACTTPLRWWIAG
jgi:hypothetical protein